MLKLGKMCVRRTSSQRNLPSLMGAPAQKRFREVSDEDPMAISRGRSSDPYHQPHWISNLTLMQPLLSIPSASQAPSPLISPFD
jgi:hypothetical protein